MDQPTEQSFSENIILYQLQQIDKEKKIIYVLIYSKYGVLKVFR